MNLFGQSLGGECRLDAQHACFPAKRFKGVSCFHYRYGPVKCALECVLRQIEERATIVDWPSIEELHGIFNRSDLALREVGLLDPYRRYQFHQHQRGRGGEGCVTARICFADTTETERAFAVKRGIGMMLVQQYASPARCLDEGVARVNGRSVAVQHLEAGLDGIPMFAISLAGPINVRQQFGSLHRRRYHSDVAWAKLNANGSVKRLVVHCRRSRVLAQVQRRGTGPVASRSAA